MCTFYVFTLCYFCVLIFLLPHALSTTAFSFSLFTRKSSEASQLSFESLFVAVFLHACPLCIL